MATVVNDRDARLLGTSQRTSALPDSTIILSADSPAGFKVSSGGVAFPTSITITANLVRLTGTVVFTASGATITDNRDNTATIAYSGMQGDSATVTASLSVGGTNYTRTIKLGKVLDGAAGSPGSAGATGNQYAVAYLYQWAPNTPSKPTGTTLFNWSTAANTGYTDSDNWSVAVPTNPGSPSLRLYVAAVSITAAGGTASSTVSYSNSVVQSWAQNGAAGASGVQAATVNVYRWDASIPASPVGTGTYTWSNGAFAAPTSTPTWVITPSASPSKGMTLYAARVSITDSATATTTNFLWTNSSISAVGYAGNDGQAAAAGSSYVTAYCASATGSATSAPAQTTGKTSLPAANSGGIVGTWSSTVPTLVAGQYMYQVDGIYDPTTDKITWSIPYWSSLKVGSLSAISANLGQITAGSMNINNKFIVDADGNVTAKSLTIDYGSGTVLGPGVPLATAYAAQGTLNSDIVIGGRNLLPDSGFERGIHPLSVRSQINFLTTDGAAANQPPYQGAKKLYFDGNGADMYVYLGTRIPVKPGVTYTISFYYMSATSGIIISSSSYIRSLDASGNLVTHDGLPLDYLGVQSWNRSVRLWTCPTGTYFIEPRFGITTNGTYSWMAVDCIKIEEGNKVTAWTPASEDVDAGILSAATTANWSGVTGSGKPQDNATVGATLGPGGNVTGTATNAKDIAQNIGTFTSPGTARTQINDYGIRVYDGTGALRIKIGQL